MDVPEMILYGTTLVSPGYPVMEEASVHEARISTPGAVRSGCAQDQDDISIRQKKILKQAPLAGAPTRKLEIPGSTDAGFIQLEWCIKSDG